MSKNLNLTEILSVLYKHLDKEVPEWKSLMSKIDAIIIGYFAGQIVNLYDSINELERASVNNSK